MSKFRKIQYLRILFLMVFNEILIHSSILCTCDLDYVVEVANLDFYTVVLPTYKARFKLVYIYLILKHTICYVLRYIKAFYSDDLFSFVLLNS